MRSLRPRVTNRCEVWSRPPWEMVCPRSRLRSATKAVSKMGTPNTMVGTIRVATRLETWLAVPMMASTEMRYPMNMLPESPMKDARGIEVVKQEPQHPARQGQTRPAR